MINRHTIETKSFKIPEGWRRDDKWLHFTLPEGSKMNLLAVDDELLVFSVGPYLFVVDAYIEELTCRIADDDDEIEEMVIGPMWDLGGVIHTWDDGTPQHGLSFNNGYLPVSLAKDFTMKIYKEVL